MRSSTHRRLARAGITAASVALIAGGVAAFASVVRSQPDEAVGGPGREAPVVATGRVTWETGYTVTRSFVGRVEPRRESDVGFELGGTLERLLADEGQLVDAGDIVAVLDTERLTARRRELVAMHAEAVARRDLADLTLARLTEALERNATNQQEFDEADKAREAADAAERRALAAIDAVDVDIQKATIRSPFDAVVSERFVDEGRVLGAGAPVLRLLERERPRARIGVAGGSVSRLSPGMRVSVRVGDRSVDGTVESILPIRDAAARGVDVLVALDAELNGLRSGDLARLGIARRIERRGHWVPMQSLTEGARGLWTLYTLDGDPGAGSTLRESSVEVLHVRSDRAFVRGALGEGDLFVSTGLHRVAPGMLVRTATGDAEDAVPKQPTGATR